MSIKTFRNKKMFTKLNTVLSKADIHSFSPLHIESDCNEFVMINGKINPVTCNTETMIFSVDNCSININGNNLTLDTYTEKYVLISGKIINLSFTDGENNE